MSPLSRSWGRLLLAGGFAAFLLAGLSIADMFRSRPYDGVVLEADAPGRLVVQSIVPGTGADAAGLQPGEQIVGIDRNLLRSTRHAAEILNRHDIGDSIPYFVRGRAGVREVFVELGPRRIGSLAYLYACVLGFSFFFIGLFVLRRQPRLRAAQIFFLVSTLFLLFLVCRLRPASYSWVDSFVLTTGTIALLFLPACFLHFFLIFPRPVSLRPRAGDPDFARRRRIWLTLLAAIYTIPPMVLAGSILAARLRNVDLSLISGAPAENWWLLTLYILLGLGALAIHSRKLQNPRERSGAALVFFGSLFGLLPFLVTAVAFPSFLHTEKFFFFGVAPLALVPLTFAYAIVRFQLLDIRIILRRSLLYTATTAVVTVFYALAIALFNQFSALTPLATSPFFPLVFALAIVLLFEPLRRRIQVIVDRRFFAHRTQLEQTIHEIGDAFTAQTDLQPVVRNLVDRLPELLGIDFAALYLLRNDRLERVAGPTDLPEQLPVLSRVREHLSRNRGITRLSALRQLIERSGDQPETVDQLAAAGVELVGELATSRRQIGSILLSKKSGQLSYDVAELDLLRRLLQQAAMALETSLLVEERGEQAELERELEIAASIQAELLPPRLEFGEGWKVAALCRPARHVGGDFYTELPGPREGSRALVYGDVAGKSVSGALLMMAAHEALHSLALTHKDPEELLSLANRRLYKPGRRRSFVAVAYLTSAADGRGLDYLLAGQPQPLLRTHDGQVRELDLPENRLPLGALDNGSYRLSHAPMGHGDLVIGYSDGVVDAQSPEGETFGNERLAEVVRLGPKDPQEAIDGVVRSLEEFTRGTDPYDDVTLVAIACDRQEST